LAASQIENYRRQPAELVSHYNREVSALDGYRGRQLLELLQNADDAGVGAEAGCRLCINLTHNRLIVANTGRPFSPKGLTSLVVSDCSPKQLDRNRFIGCKGLGFRSILAWTRRPLISSGPYEVIFDQSRAIDVVRDLASESTAVAEIVHTFRDATGKWPAAVMRFPSIPETSNRWLQEAREWRADGFDTVVVIPFGDGERASETHSEILEQLSALPASALLFCRHLTRVEITGDYIRTWQLLREDHGADRATIILQVDGVDDLWQVYRRIGQVSDAAAETNAGGRRDYEVAVAVPQKVKTNPHGTLCVFFPTHERMPCALVLHATLDTTDDRNRLVNNASNREVLKHLATHVATVMEEQASTGDPRRALELLAGAENADPELDNLGFVPALLTDCAARRVFPRLDGTLAPAAHVRQVPNRVWLDEVTADFFPDLLAVGPEDPLTPLVSLFDLGWFDAASLKRQLQSYLRSLDFVHAGQVVGRLLATGQLLPIGAAGLLLGADGKWIQDGDCFFNPVEKLPRLPEWAANIRFIDEAFQGGLLAGSKSPALRFLAADLSRCGGTVDEYRFDTVARALIDEVERGLAEHDARRVSRWQQLLRWIFDAPAGARQVLPQLTVHVITVGGAVRRATTCYLGPAYPRGQVVWRLYRQFAQDEFVAPPDACGLSGVPLDKAEEFLVALGVNAAAKLEAFQSGTEYFEFERKVIEWMDYPRTVRDRLCQNAQELKERCKSYAIGGLSLPDRLFQLLAEGDSAAIAAYLLSAGGPLIVGETDPQARFMAKVGAERLYYYDPSIPILNPILYYLRERAWVTGTDGKRHRPSVIMLSAHGVRVLRGVYIQHGIDLRDPLITAHGGREALESLLTRLGAASSLESLSGSSLYDLLLSLPERDSSGELAPGIYRTLIESSVTVEDSPLRDSFLRKGRMWARYKGVDQYLPVGLLRYNANLTVTKAIEAHIPLVAIPRRMNTALIKQLFGISSLSSEEINLRLLSEGTEYDPGSEDANQHLRSALPYIYALRLARNLDDRGRELSLLRKAVLRVCARAAIAAILPGGGREEITLTQVDERIVVDSTLIIIGEYREGSARSLTFWLGVAELVAEFLGRDVADEVGGVLRCRTHSEMLEVVRVRLGIDADAKLGEAKSRFADFPTDPEQSSDRPMPSPQPLTADTNPAPQPQLTEPAITGQGDSDSSGGETTRATPGVTTRFEPVAGPVNRPPKRRKLVVTGSRSGGGGGRGPLATEEVTFKVVEAFEHAEGRFVIRVNHLRGADGFGCDLLSVGSAEVRDTALHARSIKEVDILRYIEVKGRSSRSGEVELTDNETRAANRLGARYWLYRVFVDPDREAHFEVATLSNPLNSNAVRTVTHFDLAEGSGAAWFTMVKADEESPESPD
jgi:hypothetical protein